jgi:cell division septum initiation protein DivIVA
MSTDPDQIREDIERTRAELSSDVDALTDKVSPTQVAQRQADKVRTAVSDVKDRVMGGVSSGADNAGSAASSVGEAATQLPHAAKAKTRGNPLAAGLIAFGAGWLISSLLPSTRQEQQLAPSAKEQAAPLVQAAKDAAHGLADTLRQPAQEAAAAVKDRAVEAGSTLRDDGRSAADDLRSEAGGAADTVKGAHAADGAESGYGNQPGY